MLEGRQRLFEQISEAEQLRRRIEGMVRDAEAFEALVRPLLERALPDGNVPSTKPRRH